MNARMTGRRIWLVGVIAICALGWQLALATGTAGALVGYTPGPSSVFGAAGAGEGQFSSPVGVAVDEASGDMYVVDQGNNRVEKFDAEGKYLSQFNGKDNPSFPSGFSSPSGIAVDNSTGPSKGDVYVVDNGHNVVDKFSSTGTFIFEISGFVQPVMGVAVDSSGDLWVAEYDVSNGPVYEFNGAEDNELIVREILDYSRHPGIAVDSQGDRYLIKEDYAVDEFTPTSRGGREGNEVMIKWAPATAIAVDPATNDLFVDLNNSIAFYGAFVELNASPLQVFGSGYSSSEGISSSAGVAVNGKTGTVYASQSEADTIAIFKPALLPDVSTRAATAVQKTGAKLEGVVNPDGKEVTTCLFEYGTSTAYGSTMSCEAAPGSGSSPVAVDAELGGLAVGATYHYRLVTGNSNGVNLGFDQTLTTVAAVPSLQTEAATNIEQPAAKTIATLNGSLDPGGADTHYYFEYGETEAYGSVTPTTDAGEASKLEHAQAQLVGLRPSTLYHYRIVATNSFGTDTGTDLTFITPVLIPPPPVVGGLPATSVSQFAATFNGTIETGEGLVNYRFEYGTTTAYGQIAPIPDNDTPITSEAVPVSQPVAGLQAGTTYHYRLVVSSPGATDMKGPDETFTTLPVPAPTVSTGASSGVSVSGATLSGSVDPHGWNTEYLFQYGTSTAYGSSWPTVEVEMGALEGPHP